MKKIGVLVVSLVFVFAAFQCWAKGDYPEKTIQLICPFAPGGNMDFTARVIAEKMQEALRQPVVVLNKPGAGGATGTGYVATSKPDGYTILIHGSGSFLLMPLIASNLPYKVADFVSISKVAEIPMLIVVNKDLPVKTFPELIEYVKRNPGTVSYGGSGIGSIQHILGQFLKQQTQLDLQFIPNPGDNPTLTAVMGKHVHFAVITIASCLSQVKSGSIRAVAVSSLKRSPFAPDVPTTAEQGFPELIGFTGHILLAPVDTPPAVVRTLEGTLRDVLHDEQVRKKIEGIYTQIDFKNSQDTQVFLNDELKKWTPVIKNANIAIK